MRTSDDTALGLANVTLGVALVHRDAAADRQRGLELLMQVRGLWLRERSLLSLDYRSSMYASRGRAATATAPYR